METLKIHKKAQFHFLVFACACLFSFRFIPEPHYAKKSLLWYRSVQYAAVGRQSPYPDLFSKRAFVLLPGT